MLLYLLQTPRPMPCEKTKSGKQVSIKPIPSGCEQGVSSILLSGLSEGETWIGGIETVSLPAVPSKPVRRVLTFGVRRASPSSTCQSPKTASTRSFGSRHSSASSNSSSCSHQRLQSWLAYSFIRITRCGGRATVNEMPKMPSSLRIRLQNIRNLYESAPAECSTLQKMVAYELATQPNRLASVGLMWNFRWARLAPLRAQADRRTRAGGSSCCPSRFGHRSTTRPSPFRRPSPTAGKPTLARTTPGTFTHFSR